MQQAGHRSCLAFAVACLASACLHAEPAPERQAELRHLLRDDCGACHGMTLRGGLGPPLTTAVLRDKSDDALVAAIFYGRPGTPMPPWRRFLNEDEARWLVAQMKRGEP